MTDDPNERRRKTESGTDGTTHPTRRTYMKLVGGSLSVSGASATAAASAGAVEGNAASTDTVGGDVASEGTATSDVDPSETIGYGIGGYGDGLYGGDTDSPAICLYTTDEGRVEVDGLREAIDDWREETLEAEQLREVISAWHSGDSIPDC